MFSSYEWALVVHETYGYEIEKLENSSSILYYINVRNNIGHYLITPPFGDFIGLNDSNKILLDKLIAYDLPVKIKFMNGQNDYNALQANESGFIHQIEYKSYEDWKNNQVKYSFKRYLKRKYIGDLELRIDNSIETLRRFWEIHTVLRINKFKEIPQPFSFFKNIYNYYFKMGNGAIAGVYDGTDLVAGILFLIHNGIGYYKFNASLGQYLKHRPNNHLVDLLIKYLSGNNIFILNLGYTGDSENYSGLRRFKISIGANEYKRFIIKSGNWANTNVAYTDEINKKVASFVKNRPSYDAINEFSSKYYKYFI